MRLYGRRRCVVGGMAVVEEERERTETRKAGRTGFFSTLGLATFRELHSLADWFGLKM